MPYGQLKIATPCFLLIFFPYGKFSILSVRTTISIEQKRRDIRYCPLGHQRKWIRSFGIFYFLSIFFVIDKIIIIFVKIISQIS